MKLLIAIVSIVVLMSSFVHPSLALAVVIKPQANVNCGSLCAIRCSKAGHEACVTFCELCCQKCNCVPSGTYGNKHECPCYRDMRNSKGKPKCP